MVSGVLEPVLSVFGVVVVPVMGAGRFGGWFWTRLVRRVGPVGGGWVGVGLWGCPGGCVSGPVWGGVGVRLFGVVRCDMVAVLGAAGSSGLFEVVSDCG